MQENVRKSPAILASLQNKIENISCWYVKLTHVLVMFKQHFMSFSSSLPGVLKERLFSVLNLPVEVL